MNKMYWLEMIIANSKFICSTIILFLLIWYIISCPGGKSRVDILITTPGRLMDHLTSTPNFTLQHLRFLVIDEADRLLNQSYNDWLNQILLATRPDTKAGAPPLDFKYDKFG